MKFKWKIISNELNLKSFQDENFQEAPSEKFCAAIKVSYSKNYSTLIFICFYLPSICCVLFITIKQSGNSEFTSKRNEKLRQLQKSFYFESINNFPSLAAFLIFSLFSRLLSDFLRKNSTENFPFQRWSRARNSMFSWCPAKTQLKTPLILYNFNLIDFHPRAISRREKNVRLAEEKRDDYAGVTI